MKKVFIFGGAQFYSSGGMNDFICTADYSKAQIIAHKLMGTMIAYREAWDTEGDCYMEEAIEWIHIANENGIVLHKFGSSYGPIPGKRIVTKLDKIIKEL